MLSLAVRGTLADITVVAEGDRWVVINKPPGVLSVPGLGEANQQCAPLWCRQRYPGCTGPITVHRLDMDTSGLLLMALEPRAQRELSRQFEVRTVGKAYEALVRGHVRRDAGTIGLPLRPDVSRRPYQVVDFSFGRPAVTHFAVMERTQYTQPDGVTVPATRLELVPHTGRTHQLRVHCAISRRGLIEMGIAGDYTPEGKVIQGLAGGVVHENSRAGMDEGHPIFGDVLYGVRGDSPRLLLHARELSFDDPTTGKRVEVRSGAGF